MRTYKVSKVELLIYLWLLSVFMTFLNVIKIYPVFFLLFTVTFLLTHLSKSIFLSRRVFFLFTILIVLVLIWTASALNGNFSQNFISSKDNFKMLINYLWLCSSMCFFYLYQPEIKNYSKLFRVTFVSIFFFSLIALLYKVQYFGLWMMPFDGSNTNSGVSTILNTVQVFFGEANKNIFSTKVIFIVIATLLLHQSGFFKIRYLKTYVVLVLIFCIYCLSRTGQVVFFSFAVMLGIKRVLQLQSFRTLIPLFLLFGLFCTILVAQLLLNSFLHFDLSAADTDGLAGRVVLWIAYFQNIDLVGFLGNGAYSASEFIGTVTTRHENNFHNVFINLSYEAGWIGLICYLLVLYLIFFKATKKIPFMESVLVFTPFFVCISSHYTGYGADEVIYLANSFNIFLIRDLNYSSTSI